ncbi:MULTISPECIES: alpha/beta hydrolase family protein [Solimonas]|uniref:alpha/beta hydrolase family protein n=1 Tax=Solimonas TaxID=413435 RepID=UPI0003766714|nr:MULTISPECIES: alpha/beta fold hydrolase [Solimonas]
MREIQLTVLASDDHPLAATLFEPGRAPRAAALINPATGVPRRYYRAYARYLAEHGYAVLSYDYRGIGDSRWHAARPSQLRMRWWGERDLAAMLQTLAQRYPRLPIAAIGHSAGGQLLGLAPNNRLVDAALAVASQSGYWRLWPARLQPAMAALWYGVLPIAAHTAGRVPAALIGHELPGGVAHEWARWCRSPHYISDERGQPLREHFDAFRGRMRFYAIADDPFYAPLSAVQALADFYRNAERDVRVLDGRAYGLRRVGHFGFFRPASQALWPATLGWLHDALAPKLAMAA